MIHEPVHGLTFGDLVWIEEGANPPDESGIVYRVRPEDASLGVAVPLTTALLWLGRAGGPVAYDRTENREPVFRVTVEADDSNLLALGEMALQKQCEQPTELTYTPPDGAGETSVFDIVWSHLEPLYDVDGLTGLGMEQVVRRTQTYLVRMQALPHARESAKVVTPATEIVVTPTFTMIDDGSSATNWTGLGWGETVAVVSGRVRATQTVGPTPDSPDTRGLRRTATLDFTGKRFLAVDHAQSMSFSNFYVLAFPSVGSSVSLNSVLRLDIGGGVTRSFFTVPAGLGSTTRLQFQMLATWAVGSYVEIDQVRWADSLPAFGTTRQKALSLVPGGSVKTQGSILVSHASASLGKVIVYTYPAGTGYSPPLSPWRSSGMGLVPDATTMSGNREAIGPTAANYLMPTAVVPEGRVEYWAWLRATTATGDKTIAWSISSWVAGVPLLDVAQAVTINFPATNTWYLFCLGESTSPPLRMGPAGFVRISIIEASVTHGIQIDEGYLFATDQGRLTVVDCGATAPSAGGSSNRLWIDAPSLTEPQGSIWRGNAADRSDAWHAGGYALPWPADGHTLDPEGTSIFVGTRNTTDAVTSSEHYRRFNTFVARDA